MNELQLLKDSLQRLEKSGVSYMLTGSMASNAYGIPRSTHDLDYVLQIPLESVKCLVAAFQHQDYYVDEEAIRSAFKPPYQFNILHIPSALKVDFWILKPNPFEQEMFSRRRRVDIVGERAWVTSPEDIILHKLYWHGISPSERQLGDVSGVVAVQKGKLDTMYLRRWARELGFPELIEQALADKLPLKST